MDAAAANSRGSAWTPHGFGALVWRCGCTAALQMRAASRDRHLECVDDELDLEAELVVDALEMAIARRRPRAGLVHHSDQGSQYVSLRFGERCREIGIHRSMGSKGDCFDNAVAESLFATLEKDLLRRRSFAARQEARTAVFDYIEAFYNPVRLHSTLDYRSPIEYEKITNQEHAA